MARPGRKPKYDKPAATPNGARAKQKGETRSGYFRRVFAENPKLLRGKSNQEVLQRWLADHPGEKEVPDRIKYILSNVKSILRKQRRKRGRPKQEEQPAEPMPAEEATAPANTREQELERLEEEIDDCLSLAKSIDREGLAEVIIHLRQARNHLVWILGEK